MGNLAARVYLSRDICAPFNGDFVCKVLDNLAATFLFERVFKRLRLLYVLFLTTIALYDMVSDQNHTFRMSKYIGQAVFSFGIDAS